MFMGPKTLVLKAFCMSPELVSCKVLLASTPALLISRLRPPVPTSWPTCLAHCLMLLRSVASIAERKTVRSEPELFTESRSVHARPWEQDGGFNGI